MQWGFLNLTCELLELMDPLDETLGSPAADAAE